MDDFSLGERLMFMFFPEALLHCSTACRSGNSLPAMPVWMGIHVLLFLFHLTGGCLLVLGFAGSLHFQMVCRMLWLDRLMPWIAELESLKIVIASDVSSRLYAVCRPCLMVIDGRG